ncbi:MAG: hypothetical protein GXP47_04415, partial [Acidobacteria bacterium]|nr:hypothetical protein [Acidobacteriota bacterium]
MAKQPRAIGLGVAVMVLSAGLAWAELPQGFTRVWPPAGLTDLRCVAVAADGTVVAGGAGPGVLLSSDGGATWERRAVPDAGGLRTVAWGDGSFLAIGANGKPMTSTDGVHWTVQDADPAMDWVETVAWTGERFVAAGGGCGVPDCEGFPGYARVDVSDDGREWRPAGRWDLYYGMWPEEVVSRAGVVVAGPYETDDLPLEGVLVSTDGGETWQVVSLGFVPRQVTATGGGFFALGRARIDNRGRVHRGAASSTDGRTWTALEASGLPGEIEDLTWTDGELVAVGASGSWKSADGVHWAPLTDEHRVCMDL